MSYPKRSQSYQAADKSELIEAIKYPGNFQPIMLCTVSLLVIGLLMMVTGGVVCLVYYTEITPPNFDNNYQRYVGSSLPRIVGPMMVAYGMLLFIGNIIMMVFALNNYRRSTSKTKRMPTVQDIDNAES
ncbi:hypothetical protein GZH46_00986 [Fragariocoptes setiger]|uniref:Uncharacterized protein n=1 Tax=Fragariocoptes setiger TaxID=1670756 RepID=A0ABQ7SAQ4_9ACAR|nr:hypothetical protein GZH46_00986 [Fragariocoptes setiger]